jgi:uncharacterized protein
MPESPSSPAPSSRFLTLGLCFIVGLIAFGLITRHAILSAKRLDEYVTVKGLSEREVPADLGIWPVTFTVLDNDLSKLLEQIQKSRGIVHGFLVAQGFDAGEISNAPPQITDQADSDSDDEKKKPAFRYRANITVLLRTEKVARVKSALEACDQLVQQGIVLSSGDYSTRPQFLFTGLNKIKPEMIQEANKAARVAAGKFAADSQAHIGSIKHAVQGPFEINNVDTSSPDRKIVRVVTTVDFYLD